MAERNDRKNVVKAALRATLRTRRRKALGSSYLRQGETRLEYQESQLRVMNEFFKSTLREVKRTADSQYTQDLREIKDQLMELDALRRDVRDEMNTLKLLEENLDSLSRDVQSQISKMDKAKEVPEITASSSSLNTLLQRSLSLARSISDLEDRVMVRVADLVASIKPVLESMDGEELKEVFLEAIRSELESNDE